MPAGAAWWNGILHPSITGDVIARLPMYEQQRNSREVDRT
jgi:hypothetical protein